MVMRICFAVALAAALGLTSPARADVAQDILQATGVEGGLIVHLGCGDGRLTAALRAGDRYMVQGLDVDDANVLAAREHVASLDAYGPVTIDRYDGQSLPYIENLVNLIVADEPVDVPEAEILRVLVPEGVAYLKKGDGWTKLVKPRPESLDDWTHYLYDSSNNAVSHDTALGPLRHLQWLGSPRYSRQHDHMSSASAMVSSGGRLFHIFDYASPFSIQLPSDWHLTARDAFNGTVLWQRPIGYWHTQMFKLKSGPAQMTRRMVAIDDEVYVTLGLEEPISALDAATGETLRMYEGTERTEEIVYRDGVLYVLINDEPFRQPLAPQELVHDYVEGTRRIVAIDAQSGRLLWNATQPNVLPITLTVDDQHVLFCGDERIHCLDRATGEPVWQTQKVQRRISIPSFFGLTLVAYEDVVLFSGGSLERDPKNATGGDNTMYAFDASTGELLWTADHPASGYKSAEDILVVGGLVWITENTFGNQSGVLIGMKPRTGEVVQRFLPDVETHWFHHRCYRAKATDDYLLFSRTGIEFVDPTTEHWECHHWVRGACLYGIMPANGMVYNAPHPCSCYLEAKMYGFNALAPTSASRQVPDEIPAAGRLQRGAAYDDIVALGDLPADPADWPTYRGDRARSGRTTTPVPAALAHQWRCEIGGKLSALTVADGSVYVSSIDRHAVYAIDQATGQVRWQFTAGARVDSPPTVWQGRVLFGSTDGYVYCLRATDGQLAWRFRAAPLDRRMMSFEQIESAWPVHGSVLVREASDTQSGREELWCVAGRSMFLDGGLRLVRLDPRTGELIAEEVMDDRDPESGENLQVRLKTLNMPVALNDVLSDDGKYVYMRSQRFTPDGIRQEIEVPTLDVRADGEGAHLFSPTGFLDDDWWHRSYWVYGRVWKSGAGGYYQAGRVNPAGRPMVFNDTTVFSYGRKPEYYRWTTPLAYQLFAADKQPEYVMTQQEQQRQRRQGAGLTQKPNGEIGMHWKTDVPMLVRGMVLAGDTLFFAGAPQIIDEERTLANFATPDTQEQLARQALALADGEGGVLWAMSTDGTYLAECDLESIPAMDGLVAAGGKLYMAAADGSVICLGK